MDSDRLHEPHAPRRLLCSAYRLLSGALLLLPAASAAAQQKPRLGSSPLDDVIRAMTTEEKALLLVGMSSRRRPGSDTTGFIPEKVAGAAGRTHPIPRLGIPSLTLSDGPAGVRIAPIRGGDRTHTYYATAFPVSTLMASTWDTTLVRRVGEAYGEEVREYGIDFLLAPAMNIHRNPLGGRNFEYYSEDPVVSGHIAAAFVDGLQSQGVGATLKHFVANNQEFNRTQLNTLVSERALREIYLKGFGIAVERAQPWAVMSSYNLVDGTYTSESRKLLTDILRGDWGFRGFVMTDWGGGHDPVAQMKAGNDMLMPGSPSQTEAIVRAVADGSLNEAQLDENVRRVLRIVLETPTFRTVPYSDHPDLEGHARIARRAASEGMVLLENQNATLPLAASRNVALLGNTSYDLIRGGTGSGDVNEAYSISLDRGLADAGYTVEAGLGERYRGYLADARAQRTQERRGFSRREPIPEMAVPAAELEAVARRTDVAVLTLGRNSGEGADRRVEGDFDLTDAEHALIRSVSDAFHAAGKKLVVVLNVAGPVEVASWRNEADAILLAWQPGQEGGHAIADVLDGSVNPSGHLATTFPVRYEDVPSAGNFPGKELLSQGDTTSTRRRSRPSEVTYDEGIYAGYRYYDTKDVEPAYPFGYGLSYTAFTFGDLELSAASLSGDAITAKVTVTNTGPVAGREVAQLYVAAPSGGLDKPAQELRAFAKTSLLRPGVSQTLTFTLTPMDLASWEPARSAWVAADGTYQVRIGDSSRSATARASFELGSERVLGRATAR